MTAISDGGFRRDWRGLPAESYLSNEIYTTELTRVWRAAWLFAIPACEIPQPGDYVTVTLGDDPIILLRGNDTSIRAFHNVCPHRGSILCDSDKGHVGTRIVCPYHQWTFTREGELTSCRGMGKDFDQTNLSLRPVATESVAGLVFICLADRPPEFKPIRDRLAAAAPHGFNRAKVAHFEDYLVAANWKLIWENNRECYHCDKGHPQYIRSNYDIDEGDRDTQESRDELAAVMEKSASYWASAGLKCDLPRGGLARFPDPNDTDPFPISATRTVLVPGYSTESMDGARVAPFMGELKSCEAGVLRLRGMPNFWAHASCDHAVFTRLLPASRGSTHARVTWLVDADARFDTDYTLERLLPFWKLTSEQDWHLCELVSRGVASSSYRPGPLSRVREYNVEAFIRWYLSRMS